MIVKLLRNVAAALLLVVIPSSARTGYENRAPGPLPSGGLLPMSLADPLLLDERRASVSWESRTGPERRVLDFVCVVPDLNAFFLAIGQWDEQGFFPVLLDEPDLVLKFVRAFRPRKILRYPGKPQPIAAEELWPAAVNAVGRAWVSEAPTPPAEEVPQRFGPTPPGIVVSSPTSLTLAGAVALAAGRYQPLLRWEPNARYHQVLPEADAQRLARDLEARISDRIELYDELGDDCDFLTLAGDWPYRYETADGPNVFDDLLGRSEATGKRRAYTGRLVGSSAYSVYAAMCSLFLHSRSALLFNTIDESAGLWALYSMGPAADRLGRLMQVTHARGERASLAGWHRAFDPVNRFDLVMINSSGMADSFVVRGGFGVRCDIPWSVPAIVVKIHSHSASDPANPDSLAGRWLANGAFIYFGAVNEPYLSAFRTPTLVAEEIADRLPISVAVRQSRVEPFGHPWRLIYVGDPLFILKTHPEPRDSTGSLPPLFQAWRAAEAGPVPGHDAGDDQKLDWAYSSALAESRPGHLPAQAAARLAVLLGVRRERLDQEHLMVYDALLIDFLDEPRYSSQAREKVVQIPQGAQPPLLRRRLETLRTAELQTAIARDDLEAAANAWSELMQADPPLVLATMLTARVAALASTPTRLRVWRDHLRTTLQAVRSLPAAFILEQELKHLEETLGL
jgi:hypothetical protein